MPYEIVALHEEMPTGRVKKPKVDKYAELKELLSQVPEGKTAQVPMAKSEYRAFSAGVRAAGIQLERKAQSKFKNGAAFINWEPLTEENRPKRRGGRRKGEAATAAPAAAQESVPAHRGRGRPARQSVPAF